MSLWLPRAVVAAALVLLAGCAGPASAIQSVSSAVSSISPARYAAPAPSAATDKVGSVAGAAAPDSVSSFLSAVKGGDLGGALAPVDTVESPAGADTAQGTYRFLGTGQIRLQTWQVAGVTTTTDGGEWVFVVCQVTYGNGSRDEIPLTFRTNTHGKIVFVG